MLDNNKQSLKISIFLPLMLSMMIAAVAVVLINYHYLKRQHAQAPKNQAEISQSIKHAQDKTAAASQPINDNLSPSLSNQMYRIIISLLVLIICVLVACYYLMNRYVFNPLNSIKTAAKRSTDGKTNRANLFRSDEIGELTKIFNDSIETALSSSLSLAEKERELQFIFDAMPLRVWCKDNKNNIIRANRAAAEYLAMEITDIEGKNMAEFFPQEAAQSLQEDLQVIESGEAKLNIIKQHTLSDGTSKWVKTDKLPYEYNQGDKKGVLVIAEDISAFKQTEEKLTESEKRFQLVTQATRDGIWDWPDMQKDEEYWSPQWKALLGYEDDEIQASASRFFSFLHEDDVKSVEHAVEQHLSKKIPFDIEYRLKTKSGEYKWFRAQAIITIDKDSGKRRMTGTIADIQQQKESAEKLLHSNAELKRSNKDLNEFAYIASHDLKSPLRGIEQLAVWIEEDIAEGRINEVNDNFALLRGRVKRMEKLLNDLLIYSRAGRREETLQSVNANVLVQDLFYWCSPPATFQIQIDGELPEFETFLSPFEQVMRNLLSNAIKHHDKQDGTITVSCKKLPDSNYYEFAVEDDGPGIAAEYHELIFKMFKSLKPRDEVEGSGIGLALIKKVVETYGGEIRLHSATGKGTTFYFSWPMNISNT